MVIGVTGKFPEGIYIDPGPDIHSGLPDNCAWVSALGLNLQREVIAIKIKQTKSWHKHSQILIFKQKF